MEGEEGMDWLQFYYIENFVLHFHELLPSSGRQNNYQKNDLACSSKTARLMFFT